MQSQPTHAIQVERNVPIPMRDGTILRADVYRPQEEGRYPVILERVAYELTQRCQYKGEYFASRGYVFVGQNVRGRYASEGKFEVFRDDAWGEHQDGYDTVEWAGMQPWSNGKVGMVDGSYSGFTQYLLAPARPPHLKALFVREGGSDHYRDFLYRYGAFQLALNLGWTLQEILAGLKHETAPPGTEAQRERLEDAVANMDYWFRHLPLKSCPPLEGLAGWYFEDLNHSEDGPYWWPMNLALKYPEVDVPVMHLGGWFDCFLDGTLRSFQGIRAHGRTPECRANQRLIIGPWIHGPTNIGKSEVGELDFGPEAAFDLYDYRLRWYDYWLKGIENGIMNDPPVRIFLMGANRWLEMQAWPPENITYRPLYFRAGTGKSGTSLNNGHLSFEPPEHSEAADSYEYDPEDPVPSLLTYPELGPKDHRPVEGRMLTYTTQPLKQELTIIGPVKAVLYGMSTAPDTDWAVRLCDVWPDGRSMSVCDGILRARFRNSLEQTELMVPGEVYTFEVDLWATAQVFQAGHRLRVEVTSSDFPRYDRNLNTGGPFGEETQGQVATNTVLHNEIHASHIVLPIIE
ncbi:MAG TPA: CocE/NonD family hydrolase [Ktedonobacteraceae bacterium]|nr:CocE/NonD family hydrolase [Ktedonobacteraceae bacterium]